MTLVVEKTVDKIVIATPEIHLWSGRKKLKKAALVAANPDLAGLPPETLATMGAVKVADPEDLRPFQRLKRKAESLLEAEGLPLFGLRAIPEGKLERVDRELAAIKADWAKELAKLQRDFDVKVEAWKTATENAAWAHLIKDVPTVEYVCGRLTFAYHFYRVSAPGGAAQTSEAFSASIGGLKGELFAEAAAEATVLVEKYLVSKTASGAVKVRERITPKTLGPLRRIKEKLEGFAFVDPTAAPLAEMIGHVLALIPADGAVTGAQVLQILALGRMLASPGGAAEAARLAFEAEGPARAFETVITAENATAKPAPAAMDHAGAFDAAMFVFDLSDVSDALNPTAPSQAPGPHEQAPGADEAMSWEQGVF